MRMYIFQIAKQRWEFLKENKKTRTRPRKRSRKQELDQESDQEKKKNFFFLDQFLGRVLVFFYKFPPLNVPHTVIPKVFIKSINKIGATEWFNNFLALYDTFQAFKTSQKNIYL